MRVLHYKAANKWYREMIEKNYEALQALRYLYQKMGCQAWINMHDSEHWVLTIEEPMGWRKNDRE